VRVTLTTERHAEIGVVAAAGEVDLATVPALRQTISEQIAEGTSFLLVDLSDVTFIDSTGLGVLVGAGKKVAGVGGSMRIVCDNPRILRLLALTGLSRALGVHHTREDAMADWAMEDLRTPA
jgi:anti-sigma B factor antagonist